MTSPAATVGIIANPAAGKDIRRLISAASPTSDMAKIGIVRRAAIGAVEGGATALVVADDRHALARRALDEVDLAYEVVEQPLLSTGRDTQRAAAAMAESGVAALVVLGGDGTHRDVAVGWRQAPMVTVSTGTNNVFPRALEATTAGEAAGLVAAGRVRLVDIARQAKVLEVRIERGAEADGAVEHDLALVDVAHITSRFTGSRAVWKPSSIRSVVSAMAEPGSVGLAAIAAAVDPLGRHEPGAVVVDVAADGEVAARTVRCPVAPGRYDDVALRGHRRLGCGEEVVWDGPGTLSFDGERDRMLGPADRATIRVQADGPWVIDPAATLAAATSNDDTTTNPTGAAQGVGGG
ncbi:MAG: NAD(+)/NADH kinase [Actinomycetota bacterium]